MKIVIISYNRFPDGDAGAVRDYIFAKMLKELGHTVFVIGMGESTNFKIKIYNQIEYISLRNSSKDKISKIRNYFGYTKKIYKCIKNKKAPYLPDIIWVVNMPIHSLLSIKRFAIKNQIKLIHDSVEWYSSNQFKLGILSPMFIMKELNNRILISKNFNVVAISKFLYNYYTKKNICTTRIPILFDKDEITQHKDNIDEKLVLLYAGSPGRKDYLYTMIKSLYLLPENILEKIEFRIIGVNETHLNNMFKNEVDLFDKIKGNLNVIGRVARQEVLKNLLQADFTVLLRNPKLRYAKAGFPTKFVESIATGTPVILNVSSDLNDYLSDTNNCIIVEACSSKSFVEALIRAYNIKFIEKNIKHMQKSARLTFERYFHYENYLTQLSEFLSDNSRTNEKDELYGKDD